MTNNTWNSTNTATEKTQGKPQSTRTKARKTGKTKAIRQVEENLPVEVVQRLPEGITAIAATEAHLATLKPRDSKPLTLWLKLGNTKFFEAILDNGEFVACETATDTSIKDEREKSLSRKRTGKTFSLSELHALSKRRQGGVFYIPGQPIEYPLKEFVPSLDDLPIELDNGTTEEQWALYQEFTTVTGIEWASLLSSGGKSIHGHIKLDAFYSIEQANYLRWLLTIGLLGDPAVTNPHQPMRLAGFHRKEKGKDQVLYSHSPANYSYDRLVEAFRTWFEHNGWAFPDRITDDWWAEFKRVLKPSQIEQGLSNPAEDVPALLSEGLAAYEAKLTQARKKREQRIATARAKAGAIDGSKQLSHQVEDIIQQLGANGFDLDPHDWQFQGNKARGRCHFHESQSNSAFIKPHGDIWLFHCPTCTAGKGEALNPFTYWLWHRHGKNSKTPRGKAYVEAVKDFAAEYGYTIVDPGKTYGVLATGRGSLDVGQLPDRGTKYEDVKTQISLPVSFEPELSELLCPAVSDLLATDDLSESEQLKLAQEIAATEAHLTGIGQSYSGSGIELLQAKLAGDDDSRVIELWAIATGETDYSALNLISTPFAIEQRLYSWVYQNHIKVQKPKSESRISTEALDRAALAEIKAANVTTSQSEGQESPWDCLDSHDYQIGKWEIDNIISTQPMTTGVEARITEAETNRNLHYHGSYTDNPDKTTHRFVVWKPKLNLDFRVTKVVKSVGGTKEPPIYELTTQQRKGDRVVEKPIEINLKDTHDKQKFAIALISALGDGVACTLTVPEIQQLLQNRRAQYNNAGGREYRMTKRAGRQDDGYWVFGNCQKTPEGETCTEEESLWILDRTPFDEADITIPEVSLESNPEALKELVAAARDFFPDENLGIALSDIAYFPMQYQCQVNKLKTPPSCTNGEAQMGKTTAKRCGASIVGLHGEGAIEEEITEAALFKRASLYSCIPFILDDPVKADSNQFDTSTQVLKWLRLIYNNSGRTTTHGKQTARGGLFVTTNPMLAENDLPAASRLLNYNFAAYPPKLTAMGRLENAMDNASGAFRDLINIPHDPDAIEAIRQEVETHLPAGSSRMAQSVALMVYYTQQVCELAEFEFDVLGWYLKYYCVNFRRTGAKDSLTDFLSKVLRLERNNVIGDWLFTKTKPRTGRYRGVACYAIDLDGVWEIFPREYKMLNYSQGTMIGLLEKAGAEQSRVHFSIDRTAWVDYCRDLNAWKRNDESGEKPKAPDRKRLDCWILPCSVFPGVGDDGDSAPVDEPLATDNPDMNEQVNRIKAAYNKSQAVAGTPEEMPRLHDRVVLKRRAELYADKGLAQGQQFTVTAMELQDNGQGTNEWVATGKADNGHLYGLWASDVQKVDLLGDWEVA